MYTHTHTHTCEHTHTHMHIHMYTHTFMHACTHAHTHARTHTHTHTCTLRMLAHTHTYQLGLPLFVLQVTSIRGQPLGFEIEGGSDTPLQYTYVKSLIPNSPAEALGAFRAGDQLVMVGEECLIGLTTAEARKVLENSDGQVEIVAQRKPSPQQTPGGTPTTSTTDMRSSSRLAMRSRSSSTSSMASNRSHSGSVDMLHTSYSRGSGRDLSQRSASRQSSEVEIRDYLVKQEQMATLVPEETHTIELTKTPKQKLGLAVVGGTDNPNLKEVHVSEWVGQTLNPIRNS